MRYIPDNNLRYPVLIKNTTNAGLGSGCFFRYEKELFLVTAKHVLFNINTNNLLHEKINLLSYSRNLNIEDPIKVSLDLNNIKILSHNTDDIIIIKIGDIKSPKDGENLFTPVEGCKIVQIPTGGEFVNGNLKEIKKYENVLVSNEVFVFGYPVSIGLRDTFGRIIGEEAIEYDVPLLRKGIIAGKNKKNKTIIIDCPVYQGNSGGPVIEVDEISPTEKRFHVIGIVTRFIPFTEISESLHFKYRNSTLENSGYAVVVPADRILEIIEQNNGTEK